MAANAHKEAANYGFVYAHNQQNSRSDLSHARGQATTATDHVEHLDVALANEGSVFDHSFWKVNDTTMRRPTVAFLLTFFAAVSFLSPATVTADDTDDAIVQAAMRYVLQETGVNDPSVVVEEIEGQFARVTVTSLSGSADTSTAFLKGGNGKWKVLSIGTAFFPEDLAELGIPASLAD